MSENINYSYQNIAFTNKFFFNDFTSLDVSDFNILALLMT